MLVANGYRGAMKHVALLALAAGTATAAPAAPLDHLVAVIQTEAVRRVISLQRDDHVVLLAAASAASTIEISLNAFGGPESRLVSALVTTELPSQRQAMDYIVRVARDGDLAVVCSFAAQASITPPTCGNGSHRTIAIALESSAEEARRGITRFSVTRHELADFSEPAAGGGCRANAPISYEPTVTHFEIQPDGACSLVP